MSSGKVIGFSLVYILLYAIVILCGWIRPALFLFSISPLLIIYMAYRILKDDPRSSAETFDDKFYEDYDYRRNR